MFLSFLIYEMRLLLKFYMTYMETPKCLINLNCYYTYQKLLQQNAINCCEADFLSYVGYDAIEL